MTTSSLYDPLFGSDAMRALFDERACVQGMLDFEAALARAQARVGLIPSAAGAAIANACHAPRYDFVQLARAAASAGNAAIPLIAALGAQVQASDPDAARFVHLGATSQDAIDTGLVLQLKGALALVDAQLARAGAALSSLCTAHRATPMVARTWLQHAVPTTFGLKVAGWLDALCRDRERLQALRGRVLCVQLGGAAGTLASLGSHALPVAAMLADELGLSLPALPWHAQRDRIAETGSVLGLLAGTLGKIARDASLMMQSEVAELAEPSAPGRGGSSSMPHKRNPVGCAVVLAASLRAPGLVSTLLAAQVQEHERALGPWHAEWETLPALFRLVDGALHAFLPVLEGLHVDTARMAKNLASGGGQAFAEAASALLAPRIGRMDAQRIVGEAVRDAEREGIELRAALLAHPELCTVVADEDLAPAFALDATLENAAQLIERVLARARACGSEG